MAISVIHIVNGPNLNLLEKRDKALYGGIPFEAYYAQLISAFPDVRIRYFQSNHEGELIDYLHQYGFEPDSGIILNAGGYSHTSVALRDAVEVLDCPVVEVHISDIRDREDFRRHSYLEDVCVASIIGKGLDGYKEAIRLLLAS